MNADDVVHELALEATRESGPLAFLRSLQLQEVSLARVSLAPRWHLDPPPRPAILFHVAHLGTATVHHAGERTPLQPGDTAAVLSHVYEKLTDSDGETRPVDIPLTRRFRSCVASLDEVPPEDAANQVFCGAVYLEPCIYKALAAFFPAFVKIDGMDGAVHPLVSSLLDRILNELAHPMDGSDYFIGQLLETLLFFFAHRGRNGLPLWEMDARTLKAVQLIHESPETPWTVEQIAARVGMSRASFARHFQRTMDVTPIRYLEGIRIHRANILLRNTDLSIHEVAESVGYLSPQTFSRAFRRSVGLSPRAFRKRWRSEEH